MSHDDDVGFLYKTMIERDPKKRRVKPVESAQASLLDFDLGESSDDSDFRIEDHCEESDDDSVDSNNDGKGDNNDNDDDDDDSNSDESDDDPVLGKKKKVETTNLGDVIEKAKQQAEKDIVLNDKLSKMLICCGCLGDRSDDFNEIVECDGCGVTVHEGCYGVSDVESFSSTDSLSQSAPWFCEVCSAGIEDPDCELCPNKGGIFKETDVGKWVHLVCALYVPGVAFGEVDRLSSVTLFEMPYNKWGAKACFLCEDVRYSRTGVCIECDAGMCHTYFHVTCAQREGLLSEAHSEEVDQADPFYAHCKLHSDKALVRKRKRNWLSLQLRATYRSEILKKPEYRETEEFLRIQRKLTKHRQKYLAHKATKPPPWVPTQKMPRLLTTSASACRNLYRKAELMGIDTKVLETQEEQIASLVDIRKKWHISPAFSVEFISYVLDRKARTTEMKTHLEELLADNNRLLSEQQDLDKKYDETMKVNEEQVRIYGELKSRIELFHRVLKAIGYSKPLPASNEIAKPKPLPPFPTTPSISVIKAASLNSTFNTTASKSFNSSIVDTSHLSSMTVSPVIAAGSAINTVPVAETEMNHIPQLRHQCGICRRSTNQHLLAKCDTCQLHYHLDCLTPPLTRMPKKTKLMGWQCSECDKESSDSDIERVDTSAPRRLRHCKEDFSNYAATTIVEEAQVHKPPPSKLRKTSESKNPSTPNPLPLAVPATTAAAILPLPMPITPVVSLHDKMPPVNLHNHTNNINSIPHMNDVPYTPKLTIKPMILQSKEPEVIEIEEVNYNHHPVNNSIVPLKEGTPEYRLAPVDGIIDKISGRSGKKRRREKHKRYSPDPITGIKQRKRKHKRKSLDVENPAENHNPPEVHRRITIKIKPIPLPEGEVASDSNPQLFVASSTSTAMTPPHFLPPQTHPLQLTKSPIKLQPTIPAVPLNLTPPTPTAINMTTMYPIVTPPEVVGGRRVSAPSRKSKEAEMLHECTVCNTMGSGLNSVICDECKRCYHFTCLDPPVKKTPKRRGYSWHCADCDPSASETEN